MTLIHQVPILAGLVIALTPLGAQKAETGFLDRVVTEEAVLRRYQVFVPSNYTPLQKWPVILVLHGTSGRGNDGVLQTDIGLAAAIRRNLSSWPAIVVFPQLAADKLWPGPESEIALKALEQTQREFATDSSRLYLSGLSRGGSGAWYLAFQNPSRFAALLICCGGLLVEGESIIPAPGPPADAVAQALGRMPVWVYHGEADRLTPVVASRGIAAAFQRVGGPFRYSELPGVGHNAWDAMFSSPEVVEWLFRQRLTRP